MQQTTIDLLNFIQTSTSPYHTVLTAKALLEANGFHELGPSEDWKLEANGKYFVTIYDSALIAFRTGEAGTRGLRIAAAHTDFPCFRLKPAAEVVTNGYGTLNIEGYGGMIVSTWMDRPLSLAGKVVTRTDNPFAPKTHFVDFKRPLLTMASLAIHMNREVNDGYKWNKQKDILPLATMLGQDSKDRTFFQKFLARELGCEMDAILSFELSTYPVEKGCTFGLNDEFISSPRLDNLTSCKACLDGLIYGQGSDGLKVAALFDNEEVGSTTKQGANSLVLNNLLKRIYSRLGLTEENLYEDMQTGFMLSVDVAHAMHPNYVDKCDITNKPVLNGGMVLKQAASQSYAGDAEAVAVIKGLCQKNDIPCQLFVNRSDIKGGSTLGSMASALTPIRTMDIGVALLAMHSARETMGVKDQMALTELIMAFFK
jgi:aspartyl aminopeptidase